MTCVNLLLHNSNKMVDILCKPVHVNTSMNLHHKQKARKVICSFIRVFVFPIVTVNTEQWCHRSLGFSQLLNLSSLRSNIY